MIELTRQMISRCDKTQRPKLEELFADIEERFMSAPASRKHHSAIPGGLFKHTMNVISIADVLYDTMAPDFPQMSLVFCALVHDIGKIGSPSEPMYIPSKSGDSPFDYNPKLSPDMHHEWWTVYYLNLHQVPVSGDEMLAILNHAGPYKPGKLIETPLQIMLHSADNLSAKIDNV